MHANAGIDPEGDDLPPQRVAELDRHSEQLCAYVDYDMVCPKQVRDYNEPHDQEA